jgi:hypothetical protein
MNVVAIVISVVAIVISLATLAVAVRSLQTARAAFSINLREQWIEKFSQELKACLPTENISNRAGLRIARLADTMPEQLISSRREIIQHGFLRAVPGGGFSKFWTYLCEIQKWPNKQPSTKR